MTYEIDLMNDLYVVDILWPEAEGSKRYTYVYQNFRSLRDFVKSHLGRHEDKGAYIDVEHRYWDEKEQQIVWEELDYGTLEPKYIDGQIVEARYF